MRWFAPTCLFVVLATPIFADNWTSWRGPNFNGVAQGSGYPAKWSADQNIAWKVELPGRGSSTPIVWDDHIFLTCGVDGKNMLLSYSLRGDEQWRLAIGEALTGRSSKASGCNPSCVTDGKLVFAYFKSGDLAAVDFKGKQVWQINLQERFGKDTLWWDLGTSPVLTKDYCVVAVMQTGGSYIAAFHKTTGELAWKVDRNLDAPEEAAQSYSTPIVTNDDGKEILIVLGADHITAHRVEDGAEIWRVKDLNPKQNRFYRSIASPAILGRTVVAPYGRGDMVLAIKLGGHGDVTNSNVAWRMEKNGSDVPTPATADDRAYILSDKGTLTCVKVSTGEKIWFGNTGKHHLAFSSSPVLADGKIFLTREDGKTFVLEQGDQFKILAENELDGSQTVATPVFVNGHILVRTDTTLYCIGKK